MGYHINDIKLKHLELVRQEEVDFQTIMVEIFNYQNTWWDKKVAFRYKFKKMYQVINNFRSLDITVINASSDCGIRFPSNVDSLSFQCRLEVGNIPSKGENPTEQIIDLIALSCFTTHHGVKFNSDSWLYARFREYVSSLPLLDMLGLHNTLKKQLDTSNESWNKEFKLVEIIDIDYVDAGGPAMLGGFSMLRTIKKMQKDHRVSYEEAFLLPYSLVQSGNLESARANWVQDRMTQIKERNMRSKQVKQK